MENSTPKPPLLRSPSYAGDSWPVQASNSSSAMSKHSTDLQIKMYAKLPPTALRPLQRTWSEDCTLDCLLLLSRRTKDGQSQPWRFFVSNLLLGRHFQKIELQTSPKSDVLLRWGYLTAQDLDFQHGCQPTDSFRKIDTGVSHTKHSFWLLPRFSLECWKC